MENYRYNDYLNSFEYVSKNIVLHKSEVPKFDKAVVTFKVKSSREMDVRVAHAAAYATWVTSVHSFIKKHDIVYGKNSWAQIEVIIASTVRRKALSNFLNYLLGCHFDARPDLYESIRPTSRGFSFPLSTNRAFSNMPGLPANFSEICTVDVFFRGLNPVSSDLNFAAHYLNLFCPEFRTNSV